MLRRIILTFSKKSNPRIRVTPSDDCLSAWSARLDGVIELIRGLVAKLTDVRKLRRNIIRWYIYIREGISFPWKRSLLRTCSEKESINRIRDNCNYSRLLTGHLQSTCEMRRRFNLRKQWINRPCFAATC